jgi:hypothetical protein
MTTNPDLFGPMADQHAEPPRAGSDSYFDRLVEAFYQAALFLIERVEHDRWHFTSNYLREHARCATGMQFTNTLSPQILRALRERHPELKPYIDVAALKERA